MLYDFCGFGGLFWSVLGHFLDFWEWEIGQLGKSFDLAYLDFL